MNYDSEISRVDCIRIINENIISPCNEFILRCFSTCKGDQTNWEPLVFKLLNFLARGYFLKERLCHKGLFEIEEIKLFLLRLFL